MMMWSVLFWVRKIVGNPQVDLHQEVLWMHKVGAEWLREEVILEIMRNQEESQRGRGLNLEDQEIASTLGNQGIRRKIVGLKRTMKEINQKGTRR